MKRKYIYIFSSPYPKKPLLIKRLLARRRVGEDKERGVRNL
jgi:hypothetical protein